MKLEDKPFRRYKSKIDRKDDHTFIAIDVEFNVKIDRPKYEHWELRDRLYEASWRELEYRENSNNKNSESSPFKILMRQRLKRIYKSDRTFCIITDYSEREGSFIVEFSFFVFTTALNYGQFRESLDYFRDDISYFLKGIFQVDTNIAVDYYDRPNHMIADMNEAIFNDMNETIFKKTIEPISKELRRLKAIVMVIGILALGFSFYAVYKTETQPSQPTIDNSIIEKIVRSEIDKVNSEKNNEELIRVFKEQLLERSRENNSKVSK